MRSVSSMIRSPDDREDRGGRQEAARLRTMEMAARAAITRSDLAGGDDDRYKHSVQCHSESI